MSDPLDPSALVSILPTLLPPDAKTLKGQHDAISALLHTVMHSVGFRLVALDETSPANEVEGNVLSPEWNSAGPGSYTFRYKHEQSSMVFLLKIVKLGNRTVIHGIALEADKTQTLDILSSDYTSTSFFPYDAETSTDPLVHGFISSSRVKDLVSLYKLNVLQRLVPGLRKAGYEESAESTAVQSGQGSSSRPSPQRNPPPAVPRQGEPVSPLRDYDPLRIPSVGRRDLDPIPRNPFSPPSLFGDDGDGMFVGPNHPLFRDRLGPGRGGIGGERMGPWGGDGYLPPMGAPPGARFDPVGPGPRGGPLRGGFHGPGRGGPFGGPPFGGPGYNGREPDNDEFMPPGADDMYS